VIESNNGENVLSTSLDLLAERAAADIAAQLVSAVQRGAVTDVCVLSSRLRTYAGHDSLLTQAAAAAIQSAGSHVVAAKRKAYEERNMLVAMLARQHPSGRMRTSIPGWSDDAHWCVYVDLPTGQVSWHFHDHELHLIESLPLYEGKWDGHTTEEKYKRLEIFLMGIAQSTEAP
jgi:hypothetical protein